MTGGRTGLGAYLEATGTSVRWLAARIHVSPSTVSRWCYGQSPMADHYREAILEILRQRAALPLDGLLDDQPPSLPLGHAPKYHSRAEQLQARRAAQATALLRRSESPYDQLVGRR